MWILNFNVYLLFLLVKLVNRLGIDLELICVCVYRCVRVCGIIQGFIYWVYSGGFEWVSYMVFIGIFVGIKGNIGGFNCLSVANLGGLLVNLGGVLGFLLRVFHKGLCV